MTDGPTLLPFPARRHGSALLTLFLFGFLFCGSPATAQPGDAELSREITAAFRNYLGRAPSEPELRSRMNKVQSGEQSVAEVKARILASIEFKNRNGGDDEDWIEGLYKELRGRRPTKDEVERWEDILEDNDDRRLDTVLQFIRAGNRLPDRRPPGPNRNPIRVVPDPPRRVVDRDGPWLGTPGARPPLGVRPPTQPQGNDYLNFELRQVERLVTNYLGRDLTPWERVPYLSALQRGVTLAEIEVQILSSDEFYRRAGGTDRDWIAAVFRDVVGRPAQFRELRPWMIRYSSNGGNRSDIVRGLIDYGRGGTGLPSVPGQPDFNLGRRMAALANYYRQDLSRSLTETETEMWRTFFEDGGNLRSARELILGSGEYYRSVGGNDDRLLTALFNTFYRRIPSRDERLRWRDRIAGWGDARIYLVRAIMDEAGWSVPGDETLDELSPAEKLNVVQEWYQEYLGRRPDRQEIDRWQKHLRENRLMVGIQSELLGSEEFYRRSGGTDATFLEGLHRAVEGSNPSSEEMRGLLVRLQQAQGKRSSMARRMIEDLAVHPHDRVHDDHTLSEVDLARLDRWYRLTVGRKPSASEVRYWADAFEQGRTWSDVPVYLFGSQEFFRTVGQDREAWVRGMFRTLQDAPPNSREIDYWVSRLRRNNNDDRLQTAREFVSAYAQRLRD